MSQETLSTNEISKELLSECCDFFEEQFNKAKTDGDMLLINEFLNIMEMIEWKQQ